MYADIFGRTLSSVNCHMHSESADFLGGLRPVRDPEQRVSDLLYYTLMIDKQLLRISTNL